MLITRSHVCESFLIHSTKVNHGLSMKDMLPLVLFPLVDHVY